MTRQASKQASTQTHTQESNAEGIKFYEAQAFIGKLIKKFSFLTGYFKGVINDFI